MFKIKFLPAMFTVKYINRINGGFTLNSSLSH